MLTRVLVKRVERHDGESPFWISFSDLMSALMVLFLVVMAVTLVSVTHEVANHSVAAAEPAAQPAPDAGEQRKLQRERDIGAVMAELGTESRAFPEVKVDEQTFRIDLGDVVRFDRGRSDIQPAGARFLRRYVPILLRAQTSVLGRKWIRRVVVEGFTDPDGTYLYNLGLSLERSKRVVCSLFAPGYSDEAALTDDEKRQIRDLFLVGGYSFNSTKASKEASRRVELKVEFWPLDEPRPAETGPDLRDKDFGQC